MAANGMMGNTARDILLKKHLDEEIENRKAADEKIIADFKDLFGNKVVATFTTANNKLNIYLYNLNGTILSTATVDLPAGDIIKEAHLDLQNKKLIFIRDSGTSFACDIAELINDYTNKITAEKERAVAKENAIEANLNQEISNRAAADTALDSKITTEKERATAVEATKIDLLGKEAGSGESYHFTYYYSITPAADKINVGIETITLDNTKTLKHYDLDINSASYTSAGLMSTADKKKLDETLPAAIEAEALTRGSEDSRILEESKTYTIQEAAKKVDLPNEPVTGQGVNVPYYFSVAYDAEKAIVTDYTIDLLDKSKNPQQFNLNINAATAEFAGLMKATDAKAVRTDLPAAITTEKSRAEDAEDALQTNINNEANTRLAADNNLSERIDNLQAKGRFLSVWNCTTGLPETKPVPTEYPFTYEYKTGDYYIISIVGTSGNKRPAGTSISKQSAEAEWVIGSAAESETVKANDFYIFDNNTWTLVSSTAKTYTFTEIAGDAKDNTNLKGHLNALETKTDAISKLAEAKSYTDTTVASKVSEEETRAKAAEEANTNAIATEKSRAEAVEGTLHTSLVNAWTTINTINGRFTGTAATLALNDVNGNQINTTYATQAGLTAEASARSSADSTLQTNIDKKLDKKDYSSTTGGDFQVYAVTSGNQQAMFKATMAPNAYGLPRYGGAGGLTVQVNSVTDATSVTNKDYVDGGIATAKSEAISAAAVDATTKANTAESNAKNYADTKLATKQDVSTLDIDVAALGFTKNAGTITEIKMNGESKGTSGSVDLGTVITAHQDISGKQDKLTAGTNITINENNVISASVNSIKYKNIRGDILGDLKFVKCTQAEYDALTTKDPDTFYIIVETINN